VTGHLTQSHVKFANLATVCKYAVPEGYPDHPIKNSLIDVSNVRDKDTLYFGSVDEVDGGLFATGSRAVAVVGVANTISEAEKIAEFEINNIHGKLFHRPDIGTDKLISRRVQHMRELRS
jgi:phosphoribosylamine--glycine ligase